MTIRLDGKTAPFFIIAAGVCWGIIGIFSRQLAVLGFSPVQIAFGRSFVTAAVMVLFMAGTRASELAIAKRDIWMFLGTGLCSIVFFNICYFTAIQMTTLSMERRRLTSGSISSRWKISPIVTPPSSPSLPHRQYLALI